MGRFVLGRTLQALGSLFIVTIVIFLLARLTGDPAQLLIPDEWTREQANALRAHLGLDKPLVVQYWIYLTGLFRGDLGTSNLARLPVSELILQRLPATLELGITSVVLATVIAIPIGIYSAYFRGAPLAVSSPGAIHAYFLDRHSVNYGVRRVPGLVAGGGSRLTASPNSAQPDHRLVCCGGDHASNPFQYVGSAG